EIDVAGDVDGATGGIVETGCGFLDFRVFGKDRGGLMRLDLACGAGDCEGCEFALAQLKVVGSIINRVVEGHFAVAVGMDVAKIYVLGIGDFDRVWKWLIAADDAIRS